jgi:hypothetical protein
MAVMQLRARPMKAKGGRSWKIPMPLEAKVMGSFNCRALARVLMVDVRAAMGML